MKKAGANTEAILKMKHIASLPPLPYNWKNDFLVVQQRISDYFAICEQFDIMPTISNLAPAFGCDRKTIQRIISGNTASSPEVQALFQQTKAILEAIMLDQGFTGDSNTIACVFALKALHGYEDNPKEHQITIENKSSLSIPELEKKYLESVVVDL